MSDYIDRQAALDAIQAEREYMTRREEWLAEHILTHCGYRIIEDLPAADVEPVRHGRWIDETFSFSRPRCSVCGELCIGLHAFSYVLTDYCPHCGARMGEVE